MLLQGNEKPGYRSGGLGPRGPWGPVPRFEYGVGAVGGRGTVGQPRCRASGRRRERRRPKGNATRVEDVAATGFGTPGKPGPPPRGTPGAPSGLLSYWALEGPPPHLPRRGPSGPVLENGAVGATRSPATESFQLLLVYTTGDGLKESRPLTRGRLPESVNRTTHPDLRAGRVRGRL